MKPTKTTGARSIAKIIVIIISYTPKHLRPTEQSQSVFEHK